MGTESESGGNNNSGGNTPWGAIIGGVTGLFSNIGANRRQIESEQRQYNYSRALASHQNNMNMANWNTIWNAQNQYNSPIAQMQRLKEGGINPHLAFSKGGGNNQGSSPGLPQTSMGGVNTAPTKSILGGVMEKYMQNKSMIAQIRSMSSKADQEEIRTELMRQGLGDQKVTARTEAETKKHKAQADLKYHGEYNTETGMSKYSESINTDLEIKKIQKAQAHANKLLTQAKEKQTITAETYQSIQLSIANAQFGFVKSPKFAELPSILQGAILSLMKWAGGM